jgi:hypothetical protein
MPIVSEGITKTPMIILGQVRLVTIGGLGI